MDKAFIEFVQEQIAERLGCNKEEVYVVWMCKALQNIKGLFSSNVPAAKGLYYEVTYNGDKKELYLDTYHKQINERLDIEL